MNRQSNSVRTNIRLAQTTWGVLPRTALYYLRKVTSVFGLSVGLGDIQLIDGRWYVTHAGLLRMAQRRRCRRHQDLSSRACIRPHCWSMGF